MNAPRHLFLTTIPCLVLMALTCMSVPFKAMGQARRDVVQNTPADLVWHDGVEEAARGAAVPGHDEAEAALPKLDLTQLSYCLTTFWQFSILDPNLGRSVRGCIVSPIFATKHTL